MFWGLRYLESRASMMTLSAQAYTRTVRIHIPRSMVSNIPLLCNSNLNFSCFHATASLMGSTYACSMQCQMCSCKEKMGNTRGEMFEVTQGVGKVIINPHTLYL